MRYSTSRKLVLTVAAVGVLILGPLVSPASAAIPLGTVVSANPADWTPRLPNPAEHTATYAFAQVGGTMYAGGEFTSINGVSRHNIVAFSATTGALTSFAPVVNGQVWAIVSTSDGASLYIGGTFTTVNGVARRGLARINAVTGAVDPTFKPGLNGNVFDAHLVGGRLIVGGSFTKRLQAVDPVSGQDTGYLDLD